MRKRLYAIWSVLLVLVVSIAVLGQGCAGECYGEIEVKATLCGAPWEGPVQYTLTRAGAEASPINGSDVTHLFDVDVECGNWTCAYVSGGPDGAYLVDITPSPTQAVTSGAVVTFTLNFEEEQDASIGFLTWTINGIPIEEYEWAEYYEGYWYAEVTWSDIIDVHYQQQVDGCLGYQVTLNETDELLIHYFGFEELIPPPEPPEVGVEVLNDWCAVNKTVEPEGPDGEKLDQVTSYMGDPVYEEEEYPLPWCVNITLDVETSWMLEKGLNYTKSIDWLHIGECYEPPCDWCALFNLLVPGPGFGFELRSRASVELVDDVDVDPENNSTGWSTPLIITTIPLPPI